MTPVFVEKKGPYLFAIDPDAPITVVDPQVIADGKFVAKQGARRIDESDVTHPTRYAELTGFRVGDLTVSLMRVMISEPHAFYVEGRPIAGIIGRDVIADSLVFGFDRDRGVAWLNTQDSFHAPANAQVLSYDKAFVHELEVPRRLVHATIDGRDYDLHVDLGDAPSQLAPSQWQGAGLRTTDWFLALVDEAGTSHDVHQLGIAPLVTVNGVSRTGIAFAPYDDKRLLSEQMVGSLGLDFFRPYVVQVDWHHTKVYLTPRQTARSALGVRLERWGGPTCANPGCVTVQLDPPAAPLPADQRPTLKVTRERGFQDRPLEVTLEATRPDGTTLQTLDVSLPRESDALASLIDTRYLGARLEVVDLSPFPRPCPHGGSCITVELPPVP